MGRADGTVFGGGKQYGIEHGSVEDKAETVQRGIVTSLGEAKKRKNAMELQESVNVSAEKRTGMEQTGAKERTQMGITAEAPERAARVKLYGAQTEGVGIDNKNAQNNYELNKEFGRRRMEGDLAMQTATIDETAARAEERNFVRDAQSNISADLRARGYLEKKEAEVATVAADLAQAKEDASPVQPFRGRQAQIDYQDRVLGPADLGTRILRKIPVLGIAATVARTGTARKAAAERVQSLKDDLAYISGLKKRK